MKLPWPVRPMSVVTVSHPRLPSLRRLSSSTSSAPPSTTPINRVTRSNFESALEMLRTSVREADFVAVDLEMTGITSAPWREAIEFDRPDVRYLKVKDSAEKFAVVQFGVCPFRWDSAQTAFVAQPHNFYIFPRKELPMGGPLNEFLCQTTSIDFLAKYNFDFNACIHEGISYLSRVQEEEALRVLSLRYGCECNNLMHVEKIPLVSTFDILFTERVKIRLRVWQESLLQNSSNEDRASTSSQQQFQTVFYKLRPAILLNGFTSHQLRLIKLVVGKYFKDLVFVSANEDSSQKKLVVFTDSEKDKSLLMKEVVDDFQTACEERVGVAVGFRHVIDLLISHKKLVVGHNCFLDMAHIYNKFLGPLPSSIENFASSLHQNFPHIIDTKHLIKANRIIRGKMGLNSTSLSSAFALLCPHIAFSSTSESLLNPLVKVHLQAEGMRSSSWNSGDKHEAGYDAFMTGCVFAQVCSLLGINFKETSSGAGWIDDSILQKYINLLYLGWSSVDLIDLRTGSTIEDLSLRTSKVRYSKIDHSNIVVLWGISFKLTIRTLKECINKAFGSDSTALIYRLDETAVFIHLKNKELVSDFLILKESLDSNKDPVSVLHPLAKILEGPNTHAASYEVYKQIVSSPLSKFTFAEQARAAGVKCKYVLDVIGNEEEHIPQENTVIDTVIDKVTSYNAESSNQDGHHHLSEEILDALYVSESQFVKRTRAI